MSRTQPRDTLNLSASSVSLSEQSDDASEIDDCKLERILSEEINHYEVLDVLPPTPQRPATRSQSRASVTSSTFSATPQKGGPSKRLRGSPASVASSSKSGAVGGARKGGGGRKKRSEKDICRNLGIDLDESELEEINRDEEVDSVHVDNVIDDILNLGLGGKDDKVGDGGGVKEVTVEEEKLQRQFQKLRTKAPLEINGDGRCAYLKEDVATVKSTLDSLNAIISVLEKTRDKLINEDKNLVFTPPPVCENKKEAQTATNSK